MVQLGVISKNECEVVRKLYLRNTALQELLFSLQNEENSMENHDTLYRKIVEVIVESNTKLNEWWVKTSTKQHWTYSSGDTWSVSFDTCQVFLETRKE